MAGEKVDNLSMYQKLQAGIVVKCPKCKTGIIEAYNPKKVKKTHDFYNFVCDNCDYYIHYEPIIDIE